MATTSQASAPRYIDVHHHCVLPEYQAALVRSGAADPSRPLRKNASPQEAIDSMGTLGIDAAIVNPLSVAGVHHGNDADARYLCRTVSDALAKFAGAAPKKLGFFAPLPYPDVDGALEHMAYALDTLGADGLILLSSQNGIYVGDTRMEPLLAEMNRRKAVVFVHPARPALVDTLSTKIWGSIIEYTFETTRVAAFLIYNEFMRKYPDIKWILAHAGGCLPFISFRLILMEEQDINQPAFSTRVPEGARHYVDRFYFDTAISGSAPALAALMEVARPGHVMYGSDWPYIDRHTIDLQHECLATWKGFAPGTRTAVYRDSARALFPRFA
ncbi:MAG: amidohydrolase family protein [Hyphomicrobium sp.]